MGWKNNTSKDRDGKIVSEIHSLTLGKVKVSVVRGHRDYPRSWVGHANPFFDTKPLDACNAEEAKKEALRLFGRDITKTYEAYMSAVEEEKASAVDKANTFSDAEQNQESLLQDR